MFQTRATVAIAATFCLLAAVPAQAPAATAAVTLPCINAVVIQINCTPGTPAQPATPKVKGCKDSALEPTRYNLARIRTATLCLLNKTRASHHLGKLRSNPTLGSAARAYARKLVTQHFFDHTAPDGTTMLDRLLRTSYLSVQPHHWWVGENIAYATTGIDTPAKIVNAWMHSPGHRKNILTKRFRDIGLGATMGTPVQRAGTTYVTDFGRRIR